MREYFHTYPTCPVCYAPSSNGFDLYTTDMKNVLECSNDVECGCKFYYELDLITQSNKFDEAIKILKEKIGPEIENQCKSQKLVWPVFLNIIEQGYVDWVKNNPIGNFLITWPWPDVKFLPLLACEYMEDNPLNRIVILDDIDIDHEEKSYYMKPNIIEKLRFLFYIEDSEENFREDMNLLRKFKKLKYNDISIPKDFIECTIEEKDVRELIHYSDTIIKCKNSIIQEIEEIHGTEKIKKVITERKSGRRNEKIINENGSIKIKLQEIEKHAKKTHVKYKSVWLWKSLHNYFKKVPIFKTNFKKNNYIISDSEIGKYVNFNDKLLIFPENGNLLKILEKIKEFSPQLIIISNMDFFVYKRYYSPNLRKILEFIRNNHDKTALMFSSQPDMRYFYNLYEGSFIEENNIIPHTLDSKAVLDQVREMDRRVEKLYTHPYSSKFKDLLSLTEEINFTYVVIKKLEKIRDIIELVLPRLSTLNILSRTLKEIENFFRFMARTPLLIRGYEKNIEKYRVWSKETDSFYDYEYLLRLINDVLEDNDLISELELKMTEIFKNPQKWSNPILENLVKKIHERSLDFNFITIIVRRNEKKGLTSLLNKNGIDIGFKRKLYVCDWQELKKRETIILLNDKHLVISTFRPVMNMYRISESKVREFLFLGSPEYIDYIKSFIEKGFSEISSKPLIKIRENNACPDLIKKLLVNLEMPELEDINIAISDSQLVKENPFMTFISSPNSRIVGTQSYLLEGDKAIKFLNPHQDIMYVPVNTTLSLKAKGKIEEIKLKNITQGKLNRLKGREILLNKNGIYISYKRIFLKFMIKNANNVTFRKGYYTWNGFYDLYKSSIEWIMAMKTAIKVIAQKKSLRERRAQYSLAIELSKLNMYAKDPFYIWGWWEETDIISTIFGEIPVFRTEHPRSKEDIKKIYDYLRDQLEIREINQYDYEKTYAASILIQKLRIWLLNGEFRHINTRALRNIYKDLERQIQILIETANVFRVENSEIIKLEWRVAPFQVIDGTLVSFI